jgi:hypothetical protein
VALRLFAHAYGKQQASQPMAVAFDQHIFHTDCRNNRDTFVAGILPQNPT